MPVNTAALKTFAPAMRRQLLEAVGRKLDLLLNSQTPDTLSTYTKQIGELREQEAESREQLLELVAYTWFNRLCALRYLDARGWHPFGCKVLMPAAEGETQPELLKLMRAGSLPAELKPLTNEARLHGLLDGQIPPAIAGSDPQAEVYRELVLASCRSYHQLLPELFEGLDDASELLLPDDLLSEGSIAGGFRNAISDADCEDVEIIGWLYQFYISEKKDQVMARKKAVPTEDIPAVTQLFTPHWIVRYLVENSLGRLWLLNRPGSKLREHMLYYIEGETETDFLRINTPEEIKLLDPACGSGHMLTYAFELLCLIYAEEGYASSEIPGLILRHNLHGLEICPRAAQLAELALVFKAREQSRRFFQADQLVRPQILELQNVQFEEDDLNNYIEALDIGELFDQNLFKLLHQFEEATNLGSLIQPCLDELTIAVVHREIEAKKLSGQIFLRETHGKVLRLLAQAETLAHRYHVVVANPPYMGRGAMNSAIKGYAEIHYEEAKSDLFAIFIERVHQLCLKRGMAAMVTMHSWMFLSSYQKLRAKYSQGAHIDSLLHLGSRAFDTISGEVVQVCAFASTNTPSHTRQAAYLDLRSGSNERAKEARMQAIINKQAYGYMYRKSIDELRGIPGAPMAYWCSPHLIEIFKKSPALRGRAEKRLGLCTGNNDKFLREWHEISYGLIGFNKSSCEDFLASGFTYAPHNKGGEPLKWAGNKDIVIKFDRRSFEELAVSCNRLASRSRYFQPSITWSEIGSIFAVRLLDRGYVFNIKGPSIFTDENTRLLVCSYLNSTLARQILQYLSQTMSINGGEVEKLPFPAESDTSSFCGAAVSIVQECRKLANTSIDSIETSWDFGRAPLLRSVSLWLIEGEVGFAFKGSTLAESWNNYSAYCNAAIKRMQDLEIANSRLWLDFYCLNDEFSPEVHADEITLVRAEPRKDLAAFLSFATGCMMGRYSLDQPGLILADSRDSQAEQVAAYEAKVGKPLAKVQFKPDPDGIIPVLDGEWFEDDIVARTREFLAVTFPESSVGENLRFIEESLGKDIRKYFCSEFYKDHLQTYKKRPIYWMVQSPKKGFSCLIYLHRYTKDTLNQVLNNYFRPYLQKLEARLAQLGLDQLNDDLSARERTAARKEAEKITKVLKECQAWEQDALLPLAQQRIELNLDDGVKVNYLKLQDVLAPIPGLAAKED